MTTQLDLVRRSLAEIGTRTTITAMNDGSPEANYASLLYEPLRDFLLREGDYDWAMGAMPVVPAGLAPFPWHFAYEYPAGALRIRQLIPVQDAADYPIPATWSVGSVGSDQRILTQIEIRDVLYTLPPPEDVWDSIFQEAFVRMLGSALAFALENRIEASSAKLTEAISWAGMANLRDS